MNQIHLFFLTPMTSKKTFPNISNLRDFGNTRFVEKYETEWTNSIRLRGHVRRSVLTLRSRNYENMIG